MRRGCISGKQCRNADAAIRVTSACTWTRGALTKDETRRTDVHIAFGTSMSADDPDRGGAAAFFCMSNA